MRLQRFTEKVNLAKTSFKRLLRYAGKDILVIFAKNKTNAFNSQTNKHLHSI